MPWTLGACSNYRRILGVPREEGSSDAQGVHEKSHEIEAESKKRLSFHGL